MCRRAKPRTGPKKGETHSGGGGAAREPALLATRSAHCLQEPLCSGGDKLSRWAGVALVMGRGECAWCPGVSLHNGAGREGGEEGNAAGMLNARRGGLVELRRARDAARNQSKGQALFIIYAPQRQRRGTVPAAARHSKLGRRIFGPGGGKGGGCSSNIRTGRIGYTDRFVCNLQND